jgi:hypothetical protein
MKIDGRKESTSVSPQYFFFFDLSVRSIASFELLGSHKECVFYRQRNFYSYFCLYLHDMFRPHRVIFRCINTGVKKSLEYSQSFVAG